MVAQLDIHSPSARDGDAQPHAHILLTVRELDEHGRFAKTKALGRTWEAAFRDQKGRAMRAQVADRMNTFFESNGLGIRVDHRTNLEADGPDALPPEPNIPRAAIEAAKRNPDHLPQAVVALDGYRRDRARLRVFEQKIAAAEVRAGEVRRRINAAQERTTTMKSEAPWTQATGQLSPEQQTAARASYERWRAAQIRRGRDESAIFAFDAYVTYVQDRKERGGPRPSENKDAAFARQTRRAPDDEPGFSKRQRFLADLLAQHYDTGKLDPSVAARIQRIKLNREARTATVFLRDGSSFIDHGDRVEFHGRISQPAASEIAAAAARHGWTRVALTGSQDFRDETALALALREPPIEHDHALSPAAAARLAAALAARQPAGIAPVNMETDHDTALPLDRISPASAPAARRDGAAGAAAGRGDLDVLALAGGGSASGGSSDAGGDGDSGGLGGATDDEILPPFLRYLEPRVAAARALLATRPAGGVGNTRSATRRRENREAFDSQDVVVTARATVAADNALRSATPPAALLDAVRKSDDPAEAIREMQRQLEQEQRQEHKAAQAADEYEPADEFERPSI